MLVLQLCGCFVLLWTIVAVEGAENASAQIVTPPPLGPTVTCGPITDVPLCADVPWNFTSFPNLRGHFSQTEANHELEQSRGLIATNCSGAIVVFLCSIYAPICFPNTPTIRPCKRLCQHVRDGCEFVFNQLAGGLTWPEHMNCDHYDNNMPCFGPPAHEIDQVTIPPYLVETPDIVQGSGDDELNITTMENTTTVPPITENTTTHLTTIEPTTMDPTSTLVPPSIPSNLCEPITDVSLCSNMPWRYTQFPNLRSHVTQTEANQELEQFRQLIETNCSGAIVFFLCSIYAPVCINNQQQSTVLRPCKRLCQHVRDGCESIFNLGAGGLPWPDHLDCDNYEDDNLCFGPVENETNLVTIPPTLLIPGPTEETLGPVAPTDPPPSKCELITEVPLCADVPWKSTSYPNIREQQSQVEANQELEHFRPLIETNCSGAIVFFLCSIYAPVCIKNQQQSTVLRPCKRLCQHVRDGCESIFNLGAGGLPWPDQLDCDNYEDDNLCFGPVENEIDKITIPPHILVPQTTTATSETDFSSSTTPIDSSTTKPLNETMQEPGTDGSTQIEPHVFVVIPLAVVVIVLLVLFIIVLNVVLRAKKKKAVEKNKPPIEEEKSRKENIYA